MASTPIGLIGLGLMGTALATRLRGAGYAVLGYDLVAAKCDAIAALGVTRADSIAQIAHQCEVAVLAVFDTDQVEAVVEGELLDANTRLVICTSTCDPDRIAALAARVAPHGLALLEVPVSGTSTQVARGEGVGLIAGDAHGVRAVDAVIGAICPRRHYLGAAGNGGRAKLAINLMLGLNRAAIAEGLALAERLGLDRAGFLEVAKGSAAYSQVMDVKGALWAADRYDPPMSRVDQSLKDFTLMLAMAQRVGAALPFASIYVELLGDCVAQGEAAQDNAIIINAIRRRAAAR